MEIRQEEPGTPGRAGSTPRRRLRLRACRIIKDDAYGNGHRWPFSTHYTRRGPFRQECQLGNFRCPQLGSIHRPVTYPLKWM